MPRGTRREGKIDALTAGLLLATAIAAEVAATLLLRQSHGFTRLLPSLGVCAGYALAFYLLSLTLREIELGTAYAVWSGAGTAVIFCIGILFLAESSSPLKIISLVFIVIGVVGLNLVGGRPA